MALDDSRDDNNNHNYKSQNSYSTKATYANTTLVSAEVWKKLAGWTSPSQGESKLLPQQKLVACLVHPSLRPAVGSFYLGFRAQVFLGFWAYVLGLRVRCHRIFCGILLCVLGQGFRVGTLLLGSSAVFLVYLGHRVGGLGFCLFLGSYIVVKVVFLFLGSDYSITEPIKNLLFPRNPTLNPIEQPRNSRVQRLLCDHNTGRNSHCVGLSY